MQRLNRLSVKVFLISFIVQVLSGLLICFVLYKQTPVSGFSYATEIEALVRELETLGTETGMQRIDEFIRENQVDLLLQDEDEYLSFNRYSLISHVTEESIRSAAEVDQLMDRADFRGMGSMGFKFVDDQKRYVLTYFMVDREVNVFPKAMKRSLPIVILVVVGLSLLCSFIYTLLFARPVRRLSRVSGAMARLDFDAKCDDRRGDEIGDLARDLNSMSASLDQKIKELEAEIQRVQELERQKEMFFAAASHELKTPVTSLEGNIRGMIEGVEPYQDHDEYLARCLRTTKQMESLINEILTASRMQSAKDIQMGPVDLGEVLREKLGEMEDLFSVREIRVRTELEDPLLISGNKELTALAAGAFLSNAVLYSAEGAELLVTGRKQGDQVITEIRNTGAHIDEKDLPHLFEAFYRTDRSRSRRSGGSGLGLYIARLILTKQGGECFLRNEGNDVVAELRMPGR